MTFAPKALVIFYCGPRHGVSVRADAIESAHWFLSWTTIIETDAIESALEIKVSPDFSLKSTPSWPSSEEKRDLSGINFIKS
nr:hypothetical protein CFP56_47416 [Quercus suber]